jgi:hypothetical protein
MCSVTPLLSSATIDSSPVSSPGPVRLTPDKLLLIELKLVQRHFRYDPESPLGKPLPMRAKHGKEHKLSSALYVFNTVAETPNPKLAGTEHLKHYMSASEKAACEISFVDGKATETLSGKVIDFTRQEVDGKRGSMMYVIDLDSKIYFYSNHDKSYAHSSVVSGGYVLAAGEVTGTEDGTITALNNKSGHYRPGAGFLKQAIKLLLERGAIFSPDFREEVVEKAGQTDC